MILAAGFGTRMGVLTRERPKPLIEVAGRAMIDRILDFATEAGVSDAVINLHYKAEQIADAMQKRSRPAIRFSDETEEILETGGGLKKALPLLGQDTVLVANSDPVFRGPNPFDILLKAWSAEDTEALLLLIPKDKAISHKGAGDFFLDVDGRLNRRGDADRAPFIYASAHITRTADLADCPDGPFSLNLLWDRMIARGGLKGVVYPGDWVDVGTPEGLDAAEALLARGDV
jgi:MurNAc alpha-1-phosphate uridylyltransferase